MSELVGWIIVLGVAFAIGCSLILASRIEQHSHDTTRAAFQPIAPLVDLQERLDYPFSQSPQAATGVVLEIRRARARRRRAEDLLSV